MNLSTAGGPSFKPLPVLVIAPFAQIGQLAPFVWVLVVRSSFALALGLACVVAWDFAGPIAGLTAAATLAISGHIYQFALDGYSEPVLVMLALGALLAARRRRLVLSMMLISLAALTRPEVWPLLGLFGVLLWRQGFGRGIILLLVLGPPALWIGLDWIASGTPFKTAETAHATLNNSVANAAFPFGEVVLHSARAVPLPALVAAVVAVGIAARRRDLWVLVVGAVAAVWVGIVAVLGQLGFPGDPRFLAFAVAFFCVLAGVGLAWLLRGLASSGARAPAIAAAALVFAAFAVSPLVEAGRTVRLTSEKVTQLDELSRAVAAAGRRDRILSVGPPATNAWMQTALAWKLATPLSEIRFSYVSARHWPRHPRPGFLFLAPAKLAGPPPAIGRPRHAHIVTSVGKWRVLVVRG